MSTKVELDVPSTNGLRVALLFVNDDARSVWGWWCPTCTDRLGSLISQGDFATRDGARRSGKQHEERRGH